MYTLLGSSCVGEIRFVVVFASCQSGVGAYVTLKKRKVYSRAGVPRGSYCEPQLVLPLAVLVPVYWISEECFQYSSQKFHILIKSII